MKLRTVISLTCGALLTATALHSQSSDLDMAEIQRMMNQELATECGKLADRISAKYGNRPYFVLLNNISDQKRKERLEGWLSQVQKSDKVAQDLEKMKTELAQLKREHADFLTTKATQIQELEEEHRANLIRVAKEVEETQTRNKSALETEVAKLDKRKSELLTSIDGERFKLESLQSKLKDIEVILHKLEAMLPPDTLFASLDASDAASL